MGSRISGSIEAPASAPALSLTRGNQAITQTARTRFDCPRRKWRAARCAQRVRKHIAMCSAATIGAWPSCAAGQALQRGTRHSGRGRRRGINQRPIAILLVSWQNTSASSRKHASTPRGGPLPSCSSPVAGRAATGNGRNKELCAGSAAWHSRVLPRSRRRRWRSGRAARCARPPADPPKHGERGAHVRRDRRAAASGVAARF